MIWDSRWGQKDCASTSGPEQVERSGEDVLGVRRMGQMFYTAGSNYPKAGQGNPGHGMDRGCGFSL